MKAVTGSRIWSYRDSTGVHLAVGALACLFVLSPALFTPWSFGPDYTNHLWLVWQQALAISNNAHPTLYLQTGGGVFQPFYGFYGGTLYAAVGGVAAVVGTGHTYAVYTASIGGAIALAYGGMWWLSRLFGVGRWAAHLPAFILVTGGYYLADAYARGAWPELVALSAVPMVLAGAVRLLSAPWRPWPVALFGLGMILMTGSHNLTLLWSAVIIGPFAVVALIAFGRERPPWGRVAAVLGLAILAAGVNAWFLLLDLTHSSDVQAWLQNKAFLEGGGFSQYLYFDNLGNVLDPLRGTPSQSTTPGLAIAPPMIAFALSVILVVLAWPTIRRIARWAKISWLLVSAAMVVLVVMLVMPGSWWEALGTPFTDIQFPYRLAGWLLIAVAAQLALSLRLAKNLSPTRGRIAIGLSFVLVAATIAQAAAQMYPTARVNNTLFGDVKPREWAFSNGPTEPPATWYDPFSYADASLPVIETPRTRIFLLPRPEPGATEASVAVGLPPGKGPVQTNIAGGPYVVRLEGFKIAGRTAGGALVVSRPKGSGVRRLKVVADAGAVGTAGGVISILSLVAILAIVAFLAVRERRRRRQPLASS